MLKAAIEDSSSALAREGALLVFSSLCQVVGKPAEPFLVPLLGNVLGCYCDKVRRLPILLEGHGGVAASRKAITGFCAEAASCSFCAGCVERVLRPRRVFSDSAARIQSGSMTLCRVLMCDKGQWLVTCVLWSLRVLWSLQLQL